MAKKLLCVLLSVLMVVSLLPAGLMADEVDYSVWRTEKWLLYEYTGTDSEITLISTGSDGYALTTIVSDILSAGILTNNSYVTKVTIPEGYTQISGSGFLSSPSLKTVILPESMATISAGAFRDCTALESVNIPASYSGAINGNVFYGCTNENLVIDVQSTSITSVNKSALYGVTGTIVVYSQDMYDLFTAAVASAASANTCTATVVLATKVSASVVWDDTESHDAVTLTLSTTSGDVATVELSDDNDWAGSFSVQNYDDNLVYTVTATDVEGYTYEVTGDVTNGFVVTYTADAEEEESTELRGIYGGYGTGNVYNQETQSYSVLCTDDLSESQREATIGTTSVKFYFDANTDFASNLQYQVAYGTVYLWNFLSDPVSVNNLSMTGNTITYPLSITSTTDAYNITAGTGWTYDENNPVFLITSIEFLDSSGNVLLTLTDFSGANEEEEVDYTFPIEEKVLGSAGWSTSYDDTTGTITFSDAWTGCGWWFGSSSELVLSEFTITTGNELDWQVVVEYVDGTTSTTVSATNGTATVTPEATAISQIYIQGKAAGDLTVTDVTYTLGEAAEDESATEVEGVDIATSGWSYTYDATTGTITFSEAWAGCGWWFGSSSELILSEFTVTTGGEMDYQVVVEYVDGTASTTVASSSDGTCTVTPEAIAISQIYIQGKAAGNLTVTDVSYAVYQDTSLYYIFAFDVQDTSTWDGDWWLSSTQVEGNAEEGEVVTVTIDITDLLTATNLVADGSNLLITNSGETLSNVTMTVTYLDSQSVEQTLTYTVSSVPGSDNTIITTVTSELYNALNTSGTTVTLTFTVGAVSTRVSALTSGYQFIYVNEDYHALIVTREVSGVNRRFLISIPHEDENHDGYCDTCKEYVGTDEEEAEIVTIDDVEYEVVYSNEDGISAGNWTQVDLGDLDLIEALSQEGAILVITRDTETEVSFADGEYEKFLLIDSWWSNDQTPISLGTKGHTSSDEDVIDCTSDDGTTVIYDGATIYEAWEDGGYAEGGTSLVFISNTSASYKIVSIQVLVPVE